MGRIAFENYSARSAERVILRQSRRIYSVAIACVTLSQQQIAKSSWAQQFPRFARDDSSLKNWLLRANHLFRRVQNEHAGSRGLTGEHTAAGEFYVS